MSKIINIKTAENLFVMDAACSYYLFSYIYLFKNKFKLLKNDNDELSITLEILPNLHESISTSLKDILESFYVEPSANEIKKHSSRFEKIILNGKKYKVNYRMSINGRLSFTIYSLMNFIKEAESKNLSIIIQISDGDHSISTI